LYKKILDGDFQFPDFISPEVYDLINKTLVTDPEERYSIDQIKNHKWFSISTPLYVSEGIMIGQRHILAENLSLKLNYSHNNTQDSRSKYSQNEVIKRMKKYGFDIAYLERCLDANMHNYTTTTYYLLFKKSNKAVSKHATNPCPSTRNNEVVSNRKFIIDDLSDDSFMFPDKTITTNNEIDGKLTHLKTHI
jgi:serine/threonine protein kinase